MSWWRARVCALVAGAALAALLGGGGGHAYRSPDLLRRQYERLAQQPHSTSDQLVGRAMDFVNTNYTVMRLLARELWNVGSKVVDTIVEANERLNGD